MLHFSLVVHGSLGMLRVGGSNANISRAGRDPNQFFIRKGESITLDWYPSNTSQSILTLSNESYYWNQSFVESSSDSTSSERSTRDSSESHQPSYRHAAPLSKHQSRVSQGRAILYNRISRQQKTAVTSGTCLWIAQCQGMHHSSVFFFCARALADVWHS